MSEANLSYKLPPARSHSLVFPISSTVSSYLVKKLKIKVTENILRYPKTKNEMQTSKLKEGKECVMSSSAVTC